MSFQDTYHNEVLQSRRTRSQRAHFWAKVIGVLLMVVIGATLRSEPQLRQALMTAGMDGVMRLTGQSATGQNNPTPQQQMAQLQGTSPLPESAQMPDLSMMPNMADLQALLTQGQNMQSAMEPQPVAHRRPRDAVRVNRYGVGQGNTPRFTSVSQIGSGSASDSEQALDSKVIAVDLNRLLQTMKPGQ